MAFTAKWTRALLGFSIIDLVVFLLIDWLGAEYFCFSGVNIKTREIWKTHWKSPNPCLINLELQLILVDGGGGVPKSFHILQRQEYSLAIQAGFPLLSSSAVLINDAMTPGPGASPPWLSPSLYSTKRVG